MATDIIARGLATSNSGGGGSGTSVDVQAGTGIFFSGTDPIIINNNGVTDVQPGTNNGTVKVIIAGKESKSKEVPVKGLNNAAYKDVDTAIDETTKDSENLPTTKAVKEALDSKIDSSKLGEANGIATLDEHKKLKSVQLPSHNHGSNEVNAMTGYSKPSTLADKAIKNTDTLNVAIGKLEKNLDDKMDNGNYAGSSTKGGSATSAEKLSNTEQIGTNKKPVYFSADGVPVAIDYKLEKDVPSTAKLTDTTYSAGTGLRIDSADNNKIHNMGVLSVNESTTNGSIDITIGKNGAETSETKAISIHGLADAAYKDVDKAFGVPTLDANGKISVNQIPTTDNYNVDSAYPVTSKAVKAAIDTLPNPMVFKGSLGVGGTITALPTAESGNEGFTYKVITNGEYVGQTAKIGDLFISDGSSWIYIPSADEPDGTVTSVGISVPTGLKVKDGTSPITTSGTIEVELDEGYVIPKSADIVPSTRKVNEKILSADIVLNGADIKADGYTKVTSASDIEATDTVNQAFGKLEYKANTNATNISKNKTNISTLAKHMTGDLTDSDFSEDSTVAMSKTVPSGMSGYAAVKMIGGKTRKTKNLSNFEENLIKGGISKDSSGYFSGTNGVLYTKAGNIDINTQPYEANRVYTLSAIAYYDGEDNGNTRFEVTYTDGTIQSLYLFNKSSGVGRKYLKTNGKTVESIIYTYGTAGINVHIKDVMLELGGNESPYEPYGQLWNAPVESVVSTSADGTTETTLSLSESIKSLPDWGCSVSDDIYNYADFENGVYPHKVKSVNMGDLTYSKSSYAGGFTTDIKNKKVGVNCICGKYSSYGSSWKWSNYDSIPDKSMGVIMDSESNTIVYFKDTAYSDSTAEQFKKAMSGVMLNYELATEELIDISDMLHPIRVESGGTITFQNEHNLDTPNTVVYKKEVSLNG